MSHHPHVGHLRAQANRNPNRRPYLKEPTITLTLLHVTRTNPPSPRPYDISNLNPTGHSFFDGFNGAGTNLHRYLLPIHCAVTLICQVRLLLRVFDSLCARVSIVTEIVSTEFPAADATVSSLPVVYDIGALPSTPKQLLHID